MEILCPFCLKKFSNRKAKLICNNSFRKCRMERTKEFAEYWHLPEGDNAALRPHVYSGGFSLFGAAKMRSCPVCGDDAPDYVCPHCHNALPRDMVLHGTDIIPVIGGPAVGKTCYIVALINQLNKYGWRVNLTSSLQSLFGDGAEAFDRMSAQLFKEKQVLDKTPERRDGLNMPWFIKIENKVKTKKQRPIYLIFYDIAGEQFENANVIAQCAGPVRYASGAIVLLDTLDIPEVQKVRHTAGVIDSEHHFSIEKTVRELFNLTDKVAFENLKKMPIALTFSKVDVVDMYRSSLGTFGQAIDLKQNSLFTKQQYSAPGSFRSSDFEEFLLECESIKNDFNQALQECEMADLIRNNNIDKDNLGIFGISALGQEPEEDLSIRCEKIVPYRVLDPLIWILYKLGKLEVPR